MIQSSDDWFEFMLRAYKYRIYPTEEQKVLLGKTFGCCRYVYNWGLELKKTAYEKEKKTISCYELIMKMASELKTEKKWLREVNSQSLQSALRNLDVAYANWFGNMKTVGFPKFKSRKDRQSFQCPQHCRVDFKKSTITIPKAKDIPARLHRYFTGKIKPVTISKNRSGQYYASVLVDTAIAEKPAEPINTETTIGIDMGIKTLVVCSHGKNFENPKHQKNLQPRLKRLQKQLSKKEKGSNNREKARVRLARQFEKITCQRNDLLHKITHALTHDSQVQTICVENLNVKGMTRNHHLAQAIGDASFGRFMRMLEYKCRWYGINLIVIDRFAPSSKMCNHCGFVNQDLTLKDRTWTCPACGSELDRDYNAACNIRDFGLKTLPVECGEVKPVDCPTVDERPRALKSSDRMKQEKRGGLTPEASKSYLRGSSL